MYKIPYYKALVLNNSIYNRIIKLYKNASYSTNTQELELKLKHLINQEKLTLTSFIQLPKIKQEEYFSIIDKSINSTLHFKHLEHCFSFKIRPPELYLISRSESEKLTALIKDDLFENMSHVIEMNPGFGLLTENLLEIGVPRIHMYEVNQQFLPSLHKLLEKYPNKCIFHELSFSRKHRQINPHLTDATNIIDITNTSKLMNNVTKILWENKSCMQIIGTLHESFLKKLIFSIVFRTGLFSHGRITFYFIVLPSLWHHYADPDKKLSNPYIMFHILFNHKILGTLNRNAFIPWYRKLEKKGMDNKLYVVKLEPKPNIFQMFGDDNGLKKFWYFTRHHYYKPNQRIIPSLEKHIPDCGIRLIQKNYTIFTKFSDLNINQVFDLFMEIQSWSEYNSSTLQIGEQELEKIYMYKDDKNLI